MLKRVYTGKVKISMRPEELKIMENPDVARKVESVFLAGDTFKLVPQKISMFDSTGTEAICVIRS